MTFFTVNIDLQTLHTVRQNSGLEKLLESKTFSERLVVFVGNDKHAVFETAAEAKDYLSLLTLHGGQS